MTSTEIEAKLQAIVDAGRRDVDTRLNEYENIMQENQRAINIALTKTKNWNGGPGGVGPSFGQQFADQIAKEFSSKQDIFNAFQNQKDARLSFEIKSAGTMTLSASLTGDPQASYNPRQGITPNQRLNFRDLIPAITSPTATYVTYRETGGEGSFADQTEGQPKAQIDYDFTEIRSVSGYVAGYAKFSKQMMRHLPWLQGTLVRMLLRDFFKRENAKFYTTIRDAATGFDTSVETDPAKILIDLLTGRSDLDFTNSFILCKNSEVGKILKTLYASGFYLGSGSVVGSPDGNVRVAGVPLIGVSWADTGKVLIVDNDFVERVEVEALKIEFSFEDQDNFIKNLVTCRCEAFEDLNILRTDAHTVYDLAGASI